MSERTHEAVERRTARSEDTLIALARLLEDARRSSQLEAIALGDDAGLLLAFAGSAELCAELAAAAPLAALAANDVAPERGQVSTSRESVHGLCVDGAEMFVSGLGEGASRGVRAVLDGCTRILTPNSRLAR